MSTSTVTINTYFPGTSTTLTGFNTNSSQSKFGYSSLYYSGTTAGANIQFSTIPSSAYSNSWTIEWFTYFPSSYTSTGGLALIGSPTTRFGLQLLVYAPSGSGSFSCVISMGYGGDGTTGTGDNGFGFSGGWFLKSSSFSISSSNIKATWCHWALVFDSSTADYYLYAGGNYILTTRDIYKTGSNGFNMGPTILTSIGFGSSPFFSNYGTAWYNGAIINIFIDELRISSTNRYSGTSTITVPTGPYCVPDQYTQYYNSFNGILSSTDLTKQSYYYSDFASNTSTGVITLLGSSYPGKYVICLNPWFSTYTGSTGDEYIAFITSSTYPQTSGVTGTTVPLGLTAISETYVTNVMIPVTLYINQDTDIAFYLYSLSGSTVQISTSAVNQTTNAIITYSSTNGWL
jgi:hypothetical protein